MAVRVEKPRAIPKLRSPVVLVHGLFGFSRFQVAGCTLASYFPGIAEAIEQAGNRVLIPTLCPTGGIQERAGQLTDFLRDHSPDEPVHLIAHSMGGLDARYMISQLDMAGHVLTLTTLGTPHRGTIFADWCLDRMERHVRPLLDFFDLPCQAFYDLRTAACGTFNDTVIDAPNVRYFSVAGRHTGDFTAPEWLVPHRIVLAAEGPNDGVVSVRSATYGEDLDIWDGDHLSLINWPHPLAAQRGFRRDPKPRYAKLLGRLADLGY